MQTEAGDTSQLKRALKAIQQLRARLDAVERARTEPLAVIGMGCRFPGAGSPEAFWQLLMDGTDAIAPVPPDRWDANALYHEEAQTPGKMNTRWGGFIDGVDQFDPAFFGISPREAERMDPQQRLLLEVACEALEAAGQPLDRLAGMSGGVFIGVHSHSNDYAWLQFRGLTGIGTHTGTGTAHSILANRLSYWFDLRGPSFVVDTACSSSLVALHLACTSLRSGESDLALAGGVNLMLSPEASVTFSKLRMMASDGRCKSFDASADGFVRGEGVGLIVLKRLSDAQAAGDPVLALISGSAVNQDGATNGLTAPNGLSQQLVLRRALDMAGVAPGRVGFIETHGTGTPLGDPIEVEALAEVIGREGSEPCVLGAVKTNIGHLEAAAGIAGVIKTVLALRHGVIPPNLHFRSLNPHISLEGTRFVIPTAARPWPTGTDRHAGVSSFGFGGTNAHIVLSEAPVQEEPALPDAPAGWHHVLPVAARSQPALVTLAEGYRALLGESTQALRDVCHTASTRRTHYEHRLALTGASPEDMIAGLDAFLAGTPHADLAQGRAASAAQRGLVFVFSGQGPQWPGMGAELLATEPVFRARIEEIDALLRPLAGWSLLDELAAPAERSRMDHTEVAQPAMFALQTALVELLRAWGVAPDAVVGHSSGEVAAAHAAGVLDLDEAVQVAFHRGRLMQQATGRGGMAAIGLPRNAAEELVAGSNGSLHLGGVNAPASTLLTGDAQAVQAAVSSATARGAAARVLPVRYAFHSPQMEAFQPELLRVLASLHPRPARMRVYSTVRGGAAGPGDFDAAYWARGMRDPVLFGPAITAAAAGGGTDFLEIGPHPTLTGLVGQCLEGQAYTGAVLSTLDCAKPARQSLLRSLGALFARGYAVDWRGLHPDGGQVVSLPPHPWRRKRYWFDPERTPRRRALQAGGEADAVVLPTPLG